ncbi:MAG: sigma-70 family RNA polymerase sigma factor [Planctomycetales bacterium]
MNGNPFLKLRDRDQSACDDFVQRHYEGLYRWFLSLTRCPERASDLAQDTFMGFWQSLQRTMPQAPPHIWLYSIGRNVWRKHCRGRHRQQSQESEALVEELTGGDPSPYAVAEQREFTENLAEEVAKLPADYREALTLRLWQEFDYEEIAAVQGISRDLARWRYFRARQLVQARLKNWRLQEEPQNS